MNRTARGHKQEVNNIFLKSTRLLLFLLFPVSGFVYLEANEIVSILYGRGKFDSSSVEEVSRFLRYLALLLPMSILMNMTSKIFTALQRLGLAFYYNVFINVYLVCLIAAGTYFYGVMGYLMAFIVGYFTVVIMLLYFLLKFNVQEIDYLNVLGFFFKLLLINAGIILLIFGLQKYVTDGWLIHQIIKISIHGFVYLGLVYISARLFNMGTYFARKFYIQ